MDINKINNEYKLRDEVYLSDIDACVDTGFKNTIMKFNDNGIKTLSCCSGLISEHYDIQSLKNIIPYKESESLLIEPFVHTIAKYHNNKNNKYEYENEFYNIQRKCTRVKCTHNNKDYSVRISVDYLNEQELGDEDDSVYLFCIERPQLIQIKNMCENYEEYDNVIKKLIDKLGKIIDES